MTTRTACNIQRIIPRERTASVVATQANIARCGQVLFYGDIRDLFSLWGSVDHVVTIGAPYAAMIAV